MKNRNRTTNVRYKFKIGNMYCFAIFGDNKTDAWEGSYVGKSGESKSSISTAEYDNYSFSIVIPTFFYNPFRK